VVGRNFNLFRLLLRQHGIATQAGNESRGTALNQIDLGSEARFLRHLLMPPPYLDFLSAELVGDGLHNASREPMCQLCPLRTRKLLGPNLQGDKKGGHLATRAWDYPASRCL